MDIKGHFVIWCCIIWAMAITSIWWPWNMRAVFIASMIVYAVVWMCMELLYWIPQWFGQEEIDMTRRRK